MAKRGKNGGLLNFQINFKISDHVDTRFLLLAVGGLVTIGVIISLVIIFTGVKKNRLFESEALQMAEFNRQIDQSIDALVVTDFVMPEQFETRRVDLYSLREKRESWNQDDVDKEWISIENTELADISGYNKKLLIEMLSEVP